MMDDDFKYYGEYSYFREYPDAPDQTEVMDGMQLAAGPSPEQVNTAVQNMPLETSTQTTMRRMQEDQQSGVTGQIIPQDRTMREELAYRTQQALIENLGIDNAKARKLAETIFGGESSGVPLGVGLVDFTPAVLPMAVQESGISAGKAFESAKRGEPGRAAAEYGIGVLQAAEAIPGVKLATKAAKKIGTTLAPAAGEMFETYATRTGLTNYIVDSNKVFSGYSENVPRIKPTVRLESSLKKLDAGQINEQQFIEETRYVSEKMRQSVEAGKTPKGKVRGTDEVRRRILGAKIQGDISEEGANFADWLLTKNPQLGDELGVRIKGSNVDGVSGQYSSLNKVATLFKGKDNPGTAVHEILHHTERMMPVEIQNGVLDEWNRAYSTALAKADNKTRPYLEKMIDAINGSEGAKKIVMQGFQKGILKYNDHYQLVNPSEFWAVNATRLMQSRYEAGSWIGKAKVWVQEMSEKAKGVFGLPSDSPILRGLKEVTGGEGKFKSTEMMAQEEPVLRARIRGTEKEITAKGRKRVAKGAATLGVGSQMKGEDE
jgi:hypothetical protein